ncbi:gag-pol polyprotein [Cucumis melo var. makuwa]|uniref:Gag-pol polyprotein n=1 Tax=Cucumis melo var. makuwa TaxID=1194695 RepID=A0A5A7VCI4_CUCMM|nr:gag-pol polyprotein [Cucumis melo var. makuwa]
MLRNGTQKLDDLIGQGKRCDDKRGLRFAERKGTGNKTTVFVRECDTQNSQAENANEKYTKDVVSPWLLQAYDWKCRLELSECNTGFVVFGDRGKDRIIGKRTIDHPGLPYLLDVYLVQGLSTNLISISQLCDQGYQVSFSKDRCNVVDSQNKVFLSGTRLSDNCYHWDSEVDLCNLSKAEEVSLWHKRLGHISGTSIAKVAKADPIIGLPTLTFNP